MSVILEFSKTYNFNTLETGITVPIKLFSEAENVALAAKIDTGSTNCIFARKHGEEIGIEIENGLPKRIRTATGSFLTYEHEIALSVLDYDFDVLVCFAADAEFQTNALENTTF